MCGIPGAFLIMSGCDPLRMHIITVRWLIALQSYCRHRRPSIVLSQASSRLAKLFHGVCHMQGRAALQPVSAALEMNPKERALYLKQKHTNVLLPDDEATVASATPASLRSFLRQASTF